MISPNSHAIRVPNRLSGAPTLSVVVSGGGLGVVIGGGVARDREMIICHYYITPMHEYTVDLVNFTVI